MTNAAQQLSPLTHSIRTLTNGAVVAVDNAKGKATRLHAYVEGCEVYTAPCGWLVEYTIEDWTRTVECGAAAMFTDDGFICEHGHEHLSLEAQDRLGTAYYDEDEFRAIQAGHMSPRAAMRI